MAINNVSNLVNNQVQNAGSSQGIGNKSVTASTEHKMPTAKLDSVSLTNEAQQLQKMKQDLNTTSVGNDDKIERLKKAVASGEYQVNSDAVAKKMFSFEANLDKKLG